MVSHELRTPLNSILGWAAILGKGEVEAGRAQRALQAIQDNATRQARLVDDLLDFSRIAAGRIALDLQSVDLTTLLNAVVETVLPVAATKGVELRVDAPAGTRVVGDVRRLEQVFFNLLGNAVKFTPEGGAVRVRTMASHAEVEVSVTDTGVGIEPAFLPYVFDRFRQADSTISRRYGGLGLGLSIASQLVEAHKGSISVESGGLGRGATFTVKLPLASQPGEAAAPVAITGEAAPVPTSSPRLDGIQVLVVDDEVTAHTRDDERRQALDAGFHLHVARPIDPETLAHVVERLARSFPIANP